MKISDFFVPSIIVFILVYGAAKKVNIAQAFCEGAKENLKIAAEILPALILLMTAVGMFTASGAVKLISNAAAPLTKVMGFPSDCISLALIRPVSGSGALAVLETILTSFSPDSYTGRVASVLMGSTETTFYTIAVYYSAIKNKASASVFICASLADLTGFIFSALTVRLFFGY